MGIIDPRNPWSVAVGVLFGVMVTGLAMLVSFGIYAVGVFVSDWIRWRKFQASKIRVRQD